MVAARTTVPEAPPPALDLVILSPSGSWPLSRPIRLEGFARLHGNPSRVLDDVAYTWRISDEQVGADRACWWHDPPAGEVGLSLRARWKGLERTVSRPIMVIADGTGLRS